MQVVTSAVQVQFCSWERRKDRAVRPALPWVATSSRDTLRSVVAKLPVDQRKGAHLLCAASGTFKANGLLFLKAYRPREGRVIFAR